MTDRINGNIFLDRDELIALRDHWGESLHIAVAMKCRNLQASLIREAKEQGWADKDGKILDRGE